MCFVSVVFLIEYSSRGEGNGYSAPILDIIQSESKTSEDNTKEPIHWIPLNIVTQDKNDLH